eukprot:Cvel_27382.t1-p1 / transcript=Cvel_27382.t1 / gene=Cvel_27382 / organism=Chromera_velia_CCMP2878 / gene_product=hypothetical protein / transcript_product=hypothetical protein / location=Cvel_scaffold3407:9071-17175(+) / protein_length=674 / sequence_SO=supercontig / SO=protein_coding / is_pseudo=false
MEGSEQKTKRDSLMGQQHQEEEGEREGEGGRNKETFVKQERETHPASITAQGAKPRLPPVMSGELVPLTAEELSQRSPFFVDFAEILKGEVIRLFKLTMKGKMSKVLGDRSQSLAQIDREVADALEVVIAKMDAYVESVKKVRQKGGKSSTLTLPVGGGVRFVSPSKGAGTPSSTIAEASPSSAAPKETTGPGELEMAAQLQHAIQHMKWMQNNLSGTEYKLQKLQTEFRGMRSRYYKDVTYLREQLSKRGLQQLDLSVLDGHTSGGVHLGVSGVPGGGDAQSSSHLQKQSELGGKEKDEFEREDGTEIQYFDPSMYIDPEARRILQEKVVEMRVRMGNFKSEMERKLSHAAAERQTLVDELKESTLVNAQMTEELALLRELADRLKDTIEKNVPLIIQPGGDEKAKTGDSGELNEADKRQVVEMIFMQLEQLKQGTSMLTKLPEELSLGHPDSLAVSEVVTALQSAAARGASDASKILKIIRAETLGDVTAELQENCEKQSAMIFGEAKQEFARATGVIAGALESLRGEAAAREKEREEEAEARRQADEKVKELEAKLQEIEENPEKLARSRSAARKASGQAGSALKDGADEAELEALREELSSLRTLNHHQEEWIQLPSLMPSDPDTMNPEVLERMDNLSSLQEQIIQLTKMEREIEEDGERQKEELDRAIS